jgi:hypothetical protein
MPDRAQRTIIKGDFLKVYKRFLVSQINSFKKGDKFVFNDEDVWKFFKKNQDFMISLTASAGRVVLGGIGKFEFFRGGRSDKNSPTYHFYPGARYSEFFKQHPELVDLEGENPPDSFISNTFRIMSELREFRVSGAIQDREDVEGGELLD